MIKNVLRRLMEFHEDMMGKEEGRRSFLYSYHSLQYEYLSKAGSSYVGTLKSAVVNDLLIPGEVVRGKFGEFHVDRQGKRLVYLYKDLAVESDEYFEPSGEQDGYEEWVVMSKLLNYPLPKVKVAIYDLAGKAIKKVRKYYVKMYGSHGVKLFLSLYHLAQAEAYKEHGKSFKELLRGYLEEVEPKGIVIAGKLGKFYVDEGEKSVTYTFRGLKVKVVYDISKEDFSKMKEYVVKFRELMPNEKGDPEDWIAVFFKAPFVRGASVKIDVR
ncbi:MAG: hypothetical protein MPF33_01395 [Candidatus Aramenus sp.]|jgi:hypothetical protein|nr:hypothetical protein [Candidatus Aramenus sp.]